MGFFEMENIEFENLENFNEFNQAQIEETVNKKVIDIQKLEDKVAEAFKKAQSARDAVQYANRDIKAFGSGEKISRKEGIVRLQTAAMGLSEAQISTIEAQKILAEYNKATSQIIKYLFSISTTSLAHTRAMIGSITDLIKKGASDKLSDAALAEFKTLLVDLKAKEDAFLVQNRMQDELRAQKRKLDEQNRVQMEFEQNQRITNENLKTIMQKLNENDKRDAELEILREKERQHELKKEAEEKAAKEAAEKKKAAQKAKDEKALRRKKERDAILGQKKNKIVAGILAIFLGVLGAHWFYLGKPIRAVVYFVACMAFIPLVYLCALEGIFFLCTNKETFDKYRSWSKWW